MALCMMELKPSDTIASHQVIPCCLSDKMLLRYYESSESSSESGNVEAGWRGVA